MYTLLIIFFLLFKLAKESNITSKVFQVRDSGFLINAFKYGAPPHAGLAFGLDRFVSIMAGLDSIRDVIAFPKNNSGRDVMLDAPGAIDQKQLDELNLAIVTEKKE